MRRAAIMTIAVLILVVVSAISGFIIWISYNRSNSMMRTYSREYQMRYSKLISRSLLEIVMKDPTSYHLDECTDSTFKDQFREYLEKNRVVGYGWKNIVEDSTCVGETEISFDGDPWKDWKVDLAKLEATSGIFYIARARRRESEFEVFSWTFGRERRKDGPSATDVHNNVIYTPGSANVSGIWSHRLNAYGPIVVGDDLYLKSQNPVFHDEVIANRIVPTIWFNRATFEKDVYTKELVLRTGNRMNFKSNLYVGNLHGAGLFLDLKVDENICASSINIDQTWSSKLETGGDLQTNEIRVNGGVLEVDGNLKAVTATFLNVHQFEVDEKIESCSFEANNVDLSAESMIVNSATLINTDVHVEEVKSNEFKSTANSWGYGFECKNHFCVNGDAILKYRGYDMKFGNITVLGNFSVRGNGLYSGSKYIVSGESSIVKNFTLNDLRRVDVKGKTYAGSLRGSDINCSGGGFREKVYSPEEPLIPSGCLKDGWQLIPSASLDEIQPCSFSCPTGTCFEEAREKFEEIEKAATPFPSPTEYFSKVERMVEEATALCSIGSDSPVGVKFDGDIQIEMDTSPRRMEITIRKLPLSSAEGIKIRYDPDDRCIPRDYYDAEIICGSTTKRFKFNGIIFTEGDLTLGRGTWPFGSRYYTVYGRLFFIARGDITLEKPVRYGFLKGNSASRWRKQIDDIYNDIVSGEKDFENTYTEFVAGGNITFSWAWWRHSNSFTGEFVSLGGVVGDDRAWSPNSVLLGGIYAKNGVNFRSQGLTLITDKRLTVPRFYTCDSTENTDYEPFEIESSTNTNVTFEASIVR